MTDNTPHVPTTNTPHEPTTHVQPASFAQVHGDAPPPAPPHELPTSDVVDRHFDIAGTAWIARLTGKGACGTGAYGLGLVEAVHFFRADTPDRPVCEALLARGRFPSLFDQELAALHAKATPITASEPG